MQNHQHLEPACLAKSPWLVPARFVDTVKKDDGGSVDAANCERYSVVEKLRVKVWGNLEWLCEGWLVGRRNQTGRFRAGQCEESRGRQSEAKRGACFAELV